MVKQVILVRTDLNMRKGKLAAQVAHASMKVFFDRRDAIGVVYEQHEAGGLSELDLSNDLLIPLTPAMREWVFGIFTKVVLGVEDEASLLEARRLAQEYRLPCALIQDVGTTEFHGVPTYTTLAIGPDEAEHIDPITGPQGLVKTRLL